MKILERILRQHCEIACESLINVRVSTFTWTRKNLNNNISQNQASFHTKEVHSFRTIYPGQSRQRVKICIPKHWEKRSQLEPYHQPIGHENPFMDYPIDGRPRRQELRTLVLILPGIQLVVSGSLSETSMISCLLPTATLES